MQFRFYIWQDVRTNSSRELFLGFFHLCDLWVMDEWLRSSRGTFTGHFEAFGEGSSRRVGRIECKVSWGVNLILQQKNLWVRIMHTAWGFPRPNNGDRTPYFIFGSFLMGSQPQCRGGGLSESLEWTRDGLTATDVDSRRETEFLRCHWIYGDWIFDSKISRKLCSTGR